MKKVILILSAAAFFVACNGSATSTESTTDSTTVTAVDTNMITPAPATMDTVVTDTMNKMSMEPTKK